jgi:hypothetical protein
MNEERKCETCGNDCWDEYWGPSCRGLDVCQTEYTKLKDDLKAALLQIDGVKKIVDTYFKSRKPHADICGCWACEIRKVLLPIEKRNQEPPKCGVCGSHEVGPFGFCGTCDPVRK